MVVAHFFYQSPKRLPSPEPPPTHTLLRFYITKSNQAPKRPPQQSLSSFASVSAIVWLALRLPLSTLPRLSLFYFFFSFVSFFRFFALSTLSAFNFFLIDGYFSITFISSSELPPSRYLSSLSNRTNSLSILVLSLLHTIQLNR